MNPKNYIQLSWGLCFLSYGIPSFEVWRKLKKKFNQNCEKRKKYLKNIEQVKP